MGVTSLFSSFDVRGPTFAGPPSAPPGTGYLPGWSNDLSFSGWTQITSLATAAALTAGDAATLVSANAYTDVQVATRAPSAHTHVAANITDFQSSVDARVQVIVGAAPAALDTLVELAAALGNDASFATTITNSLALKAPLASPTFTGTPAAPTASAGTNTTQLATTAFVTAGLNLKASLASPTFTGTPAAPTAAGGTNTTQIATTAFVTAGLATKAGTTHTHVSTDVTDFAEAVDDRVGSLLVAGSNVTLTYNDGANTLTIAASGGGGGVTDHGALTGLGDDDHSIYALLSGRGSGQVLYGSPNSGGALELYGSSHATKGPLTLNGNASVYADGRVSHKASDSVPVALTDGATITIDWALGNTHEVTVAGNRTIAFSNPTPGQRISLRIQQDATGSRTITWPSGIKWSGGSAPTLSTAANAADKLVIECRSAGVYDAALAMTGLA